MKTRKPFVLVSSLLALVTVGGGLLVWSLPTLRADQQQSGKSPRSLLQIATRPPQVLFSTVEQGRSSGDSTEDYRRFVTTQIGLIKSQLVVNAALQDSGVSQLPSIKDRTDPIAWLKQNLEVTNLKDSEILQISLASGSGASGADQAAIINAVVAAYLNEVVNVDVRKRADRHNRLKEYKKKQQDILRERREVLRKLSSSVGRGGPLAGLERDVLPRLYQDLRTQQVKFRLERAETETLLARRKGIAGAATDQVRGKEIAQLEDRLAVLIASQKVLDEELERLIQEMHVAADRGLDQEDMKDGIAQMEEVTRKIGAEVEALNAELAAPSRIRILEQAVPPSP
jgi:hypothetical protein